MFGSKVASTREIIEKLQKYEKQNGIGAVKGIAIICDGDRETEYIFQVLQTIPIAIEYLQKMENIRKLK